MRVLQVVHGLPPYEWGGAELVTLHLSQALRARGHEVTVFTRTANEGEEFSLQEERIEGLHVVRVINNYTRTTSFRFFYDNPFFHEPFIRLLDRIQPEVIHFQHLAHLSVGLIPLAVALGYPTVLGLHDFFFPCHRIHLIDARMQLCAGPERGERCVACLEGFGPPEEMRRRFVYMEQTLQVVDLVITPSIFLAERMQSYFPFLKERLRTVPLGIQPLSPMATRRAAGTPLRLLCVGVLMPHKGAHVLIEALKGLPPGAIEVSFYGTVVPFWQSYVDRLHEEARGLAVRFCGSYPHDQVAAILSQHDVLVVPAICEETFSLVTREALLAGLPVIAARRGALPEAVRDGVNGLLFAPEDAADLRRCLVRLLAEPGLLDKLRPSDARVKTMDEYAEDVEGVYAAILADTHGRRARPVESEQRRVAATRHLVLHLSAENEGLRQEQEHTQAAWTLAVQERHHFQLGQQQLQRERDAARQEWEQAIRAVRELEETVRTRETQLREREVRLEAIYASTTWKLYRAYAFLAHYVFHLPSRVLKQWLMG